MKASHFIAAISVIIVSIAGMVLTRNGTAHTVFAGIMFVTSLYLAIQFSKHIKN